MTSTPASRLPVTVILGACLFLIGMAAAAVAPYRGIAAIDGLGMSNSLFALVITLGSVATALTSLVMGFFSDRIADRRWLVVFSAVMGALAYALVFVWPSKLAFILAFGVVLPLGGSMFSQTFSFARAYLDVRQPGRAQFMISVLRTLFSASWVVVPPVAGWLASRYSVLSVFGAAALSLLMCALMFGLLYLNPAAQIGTGSQKQKDAEPTRWTIPQPRLVGIGGVTLVRIAMFLHMTTLPLAITKNYGGTLGDVGLNASLAAGLEIPFMLGWGYVATRIRQDNILVINALIFGVYLLLLFRAHTVRDVLWLQGLNALSTAALLSITISYMQESIKGRVGLSTSLMDVVTVIATFTSSALFAALSGPSNYVTVFIAAGLLSLTGGGIIALSRVSGRKMLTS